MANEAYEWAKHHHYAVAGFVFVAGLVILYVFFRGGSTAAPVDDSAAQLAAAQAQEATSGNSLQALQTELQAAENQTNAEGAASSQADNAAVQLATIQSNAATNQAQIAADASTTVAGFAADTSKAQSSAAVSINAANAQSTVIQDLYDKLASSGLGLDPLNAGTVIAGTVNLNTGEFGISKSPASINSQNTPYFITDPSGAVYHLDNASATPTPGTVYGGPGGQVYVPTGTKIAPQATP